MLFTYFYLGALIAAHSVFGAFGINSFAFILIIVPFIVPLLTAGGMGLVYWRLRALSDSKGTRDALRILVVLSAALALFFWMATIVLPNGLWVEYWRVQGLGSHSETSRIYTFLPITIVPLICLLFTTYSGHVLLTLRKPVTFTWFLANHAPLLSIFVLLLFVHQWILAPYFNG